MNIHVTHGIDLLLTVAPLPGSDDIVDITPPCFEETHATPTAHEQPFAALEDTVATLKDEIDEGPSSEQFDKPFVSVDEIEIPTSPDSEQRCTTENEMSGTISPPDEMKEVTQCEDTSISATAEINAATEQETTSDENHTNVTVADERENRTTECTKPEEMRSKHVHESKTIHSENNELADDKTEIPGKETSDSGASQKNKNEKGIKKARKHKDISSSLVVSTTPPRTEESNQESK